MTLLNYRYHDFLERIYQFSIVNNQSILKQLNTRHANLIRSKELLEIKPLSKIYFQNEVLLLSCLACSKLKSVFNIVLCSMLANDKRLKINGVLLGQLNKTFTSKEFNCIYELENTFDVEPEVILLLTKYGITTLIEHLKWLYFRDESDKYQLLKIKFKPLVLINEIMLNLSKININQYVEFAIGFKLPQTKLILTNIKQNKYE